MNYCSIGIESCRGTTTVNTDEVGPVQPSYNSCIGRRSVGPGDCRRYATEDYSSRTYIHAYPTLLIEKVGHQVFVIYFANTSQLLKYFNCKKNLKIMQ